MGPPVGTTAQRRATPTPPPTDMPDPGADAPARHTRSHDAPRADPAEGPDGMPGGAGPPHLGPQGVPWGRPRADGAFRVALERRDGAAAARAAPVASSEQLLAIRLLLAAVAVWLLCIGYGSYLHVDPPLNWRKVKDRLPLMWFDLQLRRIGSILPLPIIAVRAASNMAGHMPRPVRAHRHFMEVMAIYGGLSLVRLVVYITHRDGWFAWLLGFGLISAAPMELMSDHVFLAACLASIFSSEAVLLAVDLFRHPHSRIRQAFLFLGLVLCVALYLLTCGDMFYTTFYFHSRSETLWAAVTGLLTFQLPVAWWLLYGNARTPLAAPAPALGAPGAPVVAPRLAAYQHA